MLSSFDIPFEHLETLLVRATVFAATAIGCYQFIKHKLRSK